MTKEETPKKKKTIVHHIWERTILFVLVLLVLGGLIVGGYFYWQDSSSKIYIEKSLISAPIINVGPGMSGTLEKIYVQEGDTVSKGKVIARVGETDIEAKTNGLIVGINNVPGQWVTPQTTLVEIVDQRELRVIGRIEEDKGLSQINVGQRVMFTVDAFGSRQYEGIVDHIAETSRASDIVFSISDKRQLNEFEIKVKFDIAKYPELKNGMSARMWVYKN